VTDCGATDGYRGRPGRRGARTVEGNDFVESPESRDMNLGLGALDHESFRAAVGTAAGYGVILAAMTLLLFGVPYLLFSL